MFWFGTTLEAADQDEDEGEEEEEFSLRCEAEVPWCRAGFGVAAQNGTHNLIDSYYPHGM